MKKNCLKCDKKFRTYPFLIKDGNGKYCSQKCYGKSLIGKKQSKEIVEKRVSQCRGKNHWAYNKSFSEKHKKRLSESHIGIKMPLFTEEHKRKISESNKGKPGGMLGKHQSEEAKRKIGEAHSREKNYRWNPDREAMKRNQRNDAEYLQWVKKNKKRHELRCFDCGEIKLGQMEVNHIYSWKDYPRLRYELLNGEVLCRDCHKIKTIAELKSKKLGKLIYNY